MQSSNVLAPVSPQAQAISGLFIVVLLVMLVILAIVAGLVFYIAYRFRRTSDEEPKQISGNRTLEVVWTLIPTLIVIGIFAYTLKVMHEISPPVGSDKPDVVIIAHQWWWEVHYPKTGVVTANEIHLPVDTTSLLEIESADVVHDFWVPQLSYKVDAIPNHPNYIWTTPAQVGTYLGTCAEFCGAGHAWMGIRVIVEPQDEFKQWEQHQAQPAPAPTTAEAKAGRQLFEDRTCINCHAIEGTPAQARVGPDLSHVASRETLAAGAVVNTPEKLGAWLADPQKYKPGAKMPNLQLTRSEVKSLVAYLETLK